jgi:predicted permease
VIGTAVRFSDGPYTIVGVLPPGFQGLSGHADIIVPLMIQAARDLDQPWGHSYTVIGRLRAGVTPAQVKAAMRQLGVRVDAAYPHPDRHDWRWGATARALDATRVDPMIRRSLLVLLGAVGLVLLIGCANVANLFLVRADGRRREIAVRRAVGASRGRLVRQLLTESLLLSALGGTAGLAVAWWGVKVLATLQPEQALRAPRLGGLGPVTFSSIHLDPSALAVAAALTILTGLLFGLVPALQATTPSLTGALKDDRVPPVRRRVRGATSRNILVVTEIALALVLLAGSGLMLRSLAKLLAVRPGFDAEHVLTLRVRAREGVGRDSLYGFYDATVARLAALPGVTAVGLSDCPPLNGGCSGTSTAFRDRPPVPAGTEPDIGVYWATSPWFSAMRIPLLQGRLFTDADRAGTRKVVLVNETAARTYWPGQDPIGRPVSLGVNGFWEDTAYVIGVVGDVRYRTVHRAPEPDAYISYYQSPRAGLMLFVRTAGDPLSIAAPARQVLREVAPEFPVSDVRPMTARVGDALSSARFSATLLGLFAFVALALATIGTYGVIAFAVAQRTREIGIRMALGATRRDVLRLVVGQGVALAAVGATLGIAGALAATRVLGALLYDVRPSDPATIVGVALLLGAAVVLASWIPARRAARVHPADTLRAA